MARKPDGKLGPLNGGGTAPETVPTKGRDFSEMRVALDARLASLEMYRWSWWVHWRDLAEYFLPRRFEWLVTPNRFNKGSPVNQRIIDSTGTLAARTLASGLMSGTTSPARQWFWLTIANKQMAELGPVKLWLEAVTSRMREVMAGSNYYSAKAMQYFDEVIFGTAPMIIYDNYEDPDKVIRCFNPVAGEYYAASNQNFAVDTLYRKFTLSLEQMVREFGIDNVPPEDAAAWKQRGSQLAVERIVANAIEPNPEYAEGVAEPGPSGLPRHFKFRDIYWRFGSSSSELLRMQGFFEQPFSCPRWDTESNQAYGRSPAMDALGDVKQLQLEQKRKAQAIDKMVNPPLVADISMKNQPASLLPGAMNYAPNLGPGTGVRPIFQVMPPLAELQQDIAEVQQRIGRVLFNDLFLMISNLNTVRSATEIDARKEEKLIQLGPVLERNDTEGLDPDINRIFRICARRGLFPPVPPQLHGVPIKVSYISVLADEQRATSTAAIERLVQFVGGIAAADPAALDMVDFDAAIQRYSDLLHVPPNLVRDAQQVKGLRAARAKQQAAQATMQTSMAAAQGAQTLSNTDVGGGMNALQAILAGGQGNNPAGGP